MELEEKKILITQMTDEADEDVLLAYLNLAEGIIIARCYPGHEDEYDMPRKYDSLQVRICAYLLNKRGAEGELMHNENGIYRTFGDADIPASMLREITPVARFL